MTETDRSGIVIYMNPTEYFTLDNPQGAFLLSRTAADLFTGLVATGAPETQLVFGELLTDRQGQLFAREAHVSCDAR